MSKNLQTVVFFMCIGGLFALLLSRELDRREGNSNFAVRSHSSPEHESVVDTPKDPTFAQDSRSIGIDKMAAATLRAWNDAHNARDAEALRPLYATKVSFYGQTLPLEKVIAIKRGLFERAPDFQQALSQERAQESLDGVISMHFQKKWISNGQVGAVEGILETKVADGRIVITEETDSSVESRYPRQ